MIHSQDLMVLEFLQHLLHLHHPCSNFLNFHHYYPVVDLLEVYFLHHQYQMVELNHPLIHLLFDHLYPIFHPHHLLLM
jgi:hypothetical protein